MWKAVISVAAICSTGGNLQIAPPPGGMQHLLSMLPSEVKAAGELAGTAVGGLATFIQESHGSIAARPFSMLGVLAAPVRVVHDGVSRAVYGGVSRALGAGPRALAQLTPGNGIPAADTLRGSMALGALNGAIGDRLARDANPLALDMRFRSLSGPVTPKLAVFVHGLCETDEAWNIRKPSYGSRLHAELGYTPLYLRYNSGLHISDNGRRLADLLADVVRDWPVPVDEIALVGHSMGGLVARSACHHGGDWTAAVRQVFCLGAPHLGAPLEKGANALGYALARLPETRPLARLVNGRSVGIKDLRFGSCAEEDWCDCDPDEFLRDRCTEVPFLEGAAYYFVGATLTQRPNSVVGDLLVQFPSASGNGRSRRIPFEVDNGMHLGGANHFQLLNHPAVYEQLVSWLQEEPGSDARSSRTLPPPRRRDARNGLSLLTSRATGGPAPPDSE
jgi:pimeloyl-ACP methyl ester carboxylesterase